MKRLALILTILIAAASCALSAADAPKRQGWDKPLYGDVESVTITSYFLKDSSGVLSRSKIKEKFCYNFIRNGRWYILPINFSIIISKFYIFKFYITFDFINF